ncbi:MAG: urea ABC transporter permease subunit UrtB [Myxococcales bacterium]|nr:MAG: urea ABC transporter permease subunit UrtB [Myxococcales bacterium]
MQGFAGLSLFTVLLLMALGLAIIFGQMGVINMAHGEFMAIGAYVVYWCSQLTQQFAPSLANVYFIPAIVLAFVVAALAGLVVEVLLVRRLYNRPLDTLLATWGLSLMMQQIFRSVFGAKEVSAVLPEWMLGSFVPTEGVDIPRNGVFVMVLTILVASGVYYTLFRSRWGVRIRATTQNRMMSGAVGIDTDRVDRFSFALGCGIAGVAGAAFTTIGSTGPTSGSLYIVDTFLVVVFGGAANLLGTIASAFSIAQAQSLLEFFLTSAMAKVLTLLSIIVILMMRPQGLFATKVRA